MQELSPTSQLLLRNLPRMLELGGKQLLMVNPPADYLSGELSRKGIQNLTINSSDYQIYQHIKQHSIDTALTVNFTTEIQNSDNKAPGLAIVFLPREKPFLDYLLAQTISALATGGVIWLVGENRAGIKSTTKRLNLLSGNSVRKLDSARHCSLLETVKGDACGPSPQPPACGFELEFNQKNWQFTTLPGVFSYGKLDPASLMLLSNLQKQPLKGRVLDFACGCGVLGICASSLKPGISLELLDVSAMAIASTRVNIQQAGIASENVNALASDAYSTVEGRFDAIISNPPFHRDTRQTLEVSQKLIQQAPLYLKARGELRIVANRHLPYLKLFQETVRRVEVLASDRYFHVIQGKFPFTHRT